MCCIKEERFAKLKLRLNDVEMEEMRCFKALRGCNVCLHRIGRQVKVQERKVWGILRESIEGDNVEAKR